LNCFKLSSKEGGGSRFQRGSNQLNDYSSVARTRLGSSATGIASDADLEAVILVEIDWEESASLCFFVLAQAYEEQLYYQSVYLSLTEEASIWGSMKLLA
jgi:hypothetical protein